MYGIWRGKRSHGVIILPVCPVVYTLVALIIIVRRLKTSNRSKKFTLEYRTSFIKGFSLERLRNSKIKIISVKIIVSP